MKNQQLLIIGIALLMPCATSATVLFESNWSTATGNETDALSDGGKWDVSLCPELRADVLSVVPASTVDFALSDNVLRVTSAGRKCGRALVDHMVPASTTHWARFYWRNDETQNVHGHPTSYPTGIGGETIEIVPWNRWGQINGHQIGTVNHGPGVAGVGPTLLQNGVWYRYEWQIEYLTATTYRLWPRVYDINGVLLYNASNYITAQWPFANTLQSYYDGGGFYSISNPEAAREFSLGNEGPNIEENNGQHWYFASVAFSTSDWIGGASNPPSDTTPPIAVVTNPSQGATYTAGTVQVAFNITTDENATCRWAVTDMPYENMHLTRTLAGNGTHHNGLFTRLMAGDHARYIRCHDAWNNTMIASAVSTFSISGATSGQVFYDDFETGARSARQSGYGWGSQTAVSVTNNLSYSGDYALEFRFGPDTLTVDDDAWAEQRFTLGEYLPELWIEYMLYIPPNFYHRHIPGGSSNNKFLLAWGDYYGPPSGNWLGGYEYTRNDAIDGDSNLRAYGRSPYAVLMDLQNPQISTTNPLISNNGPIIRGEWNNIRARFKMATGPDTYDGVMELWINGELKYQKTDGRFWHGQNMTNGSSNPDFTDPTTTLKNGYILGWANSGFTERTNLYVDDVRMYKSNPGWRSNTNDTIINNRSLTRTSSGTSHSHFVTLPVGSNRTIVTCTSLEHASATFSDMRFNSALMTVVHDRRQGSAYLACYKYDAPDALASGTYTVTYTTSVSATTALAAWPLRNARAGGPEFAGSTTLAANVVANLSLPVTNVSEGSWILTAATDTTSSGTYSVRQPLTYRAGTSLTGHYTLYGDDYRERAGPEEVQWQGSLTSGDRVAIAMSFPNMYAISEPGAEPPPLVRRVGDLNGDSIVDLQDVILIVENFRRRGNYDAGADINSDGTVNVLDMVLLGKNWGGSTATTGFAFASDFSTGVGTDSLVVRDTAKRIPWAQLSGGSSGPNASEVLSAAAVDFPSQNALLIRATNFNGGGASSRILRINNTIPVPAVGESLYYRWYFRLVNPDTTTTGTAHPIQDGWAAGLLNWNFQVRAADNSNVWQLRWSIGTATWPNDSWLVNNLEKHKTYRVEMRLHRVSETTFTIHPRIYDTAGNLLYDKEQFGNANGNMTLAANPVFTFLNINELGGLNAGSNGAMQGTVAEDYPFDFSWQGAFCVRTDTWCGEYQIGEGP